ncbi:hypothetical protein [Burkholderia gladioli]|uniref:hypothetical protein n=1 Tax=Burkholderia gladioli TaxID=28095 RepID=UPI00163E5561|nr:hypothetical protein [Burkholderia gladioli]
MTDQTSTRARADFDDESELDEMERKAFEMLRDIQERYQREAEPVIRHLADIRALRRPRPITVSAEAFASIELAMTGIYTFPEAQ